VLRFRPTVTDASVRTVWWLARVAQPIGQIRLGFDVEAPHGDGSGRRIDQGVAEPDAGLPG
jgi:hypothetical protein